MVKKKKRTRSQDLDLEILSVERARHHEDPQIKLKGGKRFECSCMSNLHQVFVVVKFVETQDDEAAKVAEARAKLGKSKGKDPKDPKDAKDGEASKPKKGKEARHWDGGKVSKSLMQETGQL